MDAEKYFSACKGCNRQILLIYNCIGSHSYYFISAAPQPLPRSTASERRPKRRAPTPPPGSDEPPLDLNLEDEDRNPFKARAPTPPLDSDHSDKDDYEILAQAESCSAPFPISSVDSMLSVHDPTAHYLHPVSQDSAFTVAASAMTETANGEVNNNDDGVVGSDDGVVGAVGGCEIKNNNVEEEIIYEEKYLAEPFRKFLKTRKEDNDVHFV